MHTKSQGTSESCAILTSSCSWSIRLSSSSFSLTASSRNCFSRARRVLSSWNTATVLRRSSAELLRWQTPAFPSKVFFLLISVGLFWFLMCIFDNIIAWQKHISWITALTETPPFPQSVFILILFFYPPFPPCLLFCFLNLWRAFFVFDASLWQHYCTMKTRPMNGYWTPHFIFIKGHPTIKTIFAWLICGWS